MVGLALKAQAGRLTTQRAAKNGNFSILAIAKRYSYGILWPATIKLIVGRR